MLKKEKILDNNINNIGISIVEGVCLKNRRNELFWWDQITPDPKRMLCVFELGILYEGQFNAVNKLINNGLNVFRSKKLPSEMEFMNTLNRSQIFNLKKLLNYNLKNSIL